MHLISKGSISEIRGDGRGLAYLCARSAIQVVDLDRQKVIKRLGNGKNFYHIAINSNGNLIAVNAIPETLFIYDSGTGKTIFSLNLANMYHAELGSEIFFSPDDKYIVTGDSSGNIYLIDWSCKEVHIIKHFDTSIDAIQFDMVNTFTFYITDTGILQWKYPFEENSPRFISMKMIKNTYNNTSLEFSFHRFCFINEKKAFAANIRITEGLQFKKCLGIFNTDITSLMGVGIYAKDKLLTQFRIFWSNDGEYLALLNYFEEKDHNVYIVKFNGLEIIKTYFIANPSYAWFVDRDKVMVSSDFRGVYILTV